MRFLKQHWWRYSIFIVCLSAYGALYATWWSLIPGLIVVMWWVELLDKTSYDQEIKTADGGVLKIRTRGYSKEEVQRFADELKEEAR